MDTATAPVMSDLKLTFRIPDENEPGGMRFYREAGDARAHMIRISKAIQSGKLPSSEDIDKLVHYLLLFVPREQLEGARDIIMDYSMRQLIDALRLISDTSVDFAEQVVAKGRVRPTPELVESAQRVQRSSAELAEA